MANIKNFITGVLIAIVTALADQYTKVLAFSFVEQNHHQAIEITSFFNIVKVYNYGVSFGMFNDLQYGKIILSVVAIAITIFLLVWLAKVKKTYMVVALGLIIGGALGNIYDRVMIGAVADFLDFYIGEYHWPAFNLADSAIFVGVAIILLDSFLEDKKKDK